MTTTNAAPTLTAVDEVEFFARRVTLVAALPLVRTKHYPKSAEHERELERQTRDAFGPAVIAAYLRCVELGASISAVVTTSRERGKEVGIRVDGTRFALVDTNAGDRAAVTDAIVAYVTGPGTPHALERECAQREALGADNLDTPDDDDG